MDPPHLDTAGTEIDPLHLDEAETEIGPAEYLDDTVSSSTGDLQAEKIHEYNVSDTKGKYFDETVYDSQGKKKFFFVSVDFGKLFLDSIQMITMVML